MAALRRTVAETRRLGWRMCKWGHQASCRLRGKRCCQERVLTSAEIWPLPAPARPAGSLLASSACIPEAASRVRDGRTRARSKTLHFLHSQIMQSRFAALHTVASGVRPRDARVGHPHRPVSARAPEAGWRTELRAVAARDASTPPAQIRTVFRQVSPFPQQPPDVVACAVGLPHHTRRPASVATLPQDPRLAHLTDANAAD